MDGAEDKKNTLMTRTEVINRVREKLIKLQLYNNEAIKTFGPSIAKEMFLSDLDYLTSILVYIGTDEKEKGN